MRRVLNVYGPGDVRLDSATLPDVGPNDVLVDIRACGICGSDLNYIRQGLLNMAGESPKPLGHEAAGVVIEVGSEVEGIEPGIHVIINPMIAGSVIGNGSDEGAFTERLLVRGAQSNVTLYPMSEGIDFEVAALAEPLAVSLHGVNRGQVKPGDLAVVFGVGPIGLGMVLCLKHRGLTNIVSVARSASRLERARALGATATISAEQENVRERLAELHGREHTRFGEAVGTDVYFDAAGASNIVPDIIEMAKPDSRLVISAMYSAPVEINLVSFLIREMHITSAVGYPTEFPEVIDMLAEHGEEARRMISHRLAFDDIMAALDIASSTKCGKVMITFPQD
jgi:(R,R)-butanediol dehydrogenase/meso-butanediol dehydrogenase/diacetyl reductase